MERWIYGLYWTCWLYSTAELEILSNHINLGSSSEDCHTQAMLQQKKSLARQVVLHRCLKGSAVGKFNILRSSHHQPLCVISQRQEALNSQPLHLTFPKVLLLTPFQLYLLGTLPTTTCSYCAMFPLSQIIFPFRVLFSLVAFHNIPFSPGWISL